MRKGLADKNPSYGVHRNSEKPRRRYVEDTEFYAFLKFAETKCEQSKRKHDGYLMLCITAEIAYLTGQRREDVLVVPRRNVRDDGILFEQKKEQRGDASTRAVDRCAARGCGQSEGAPAPHLWPLLSVQQAWSALHRRGFQDYVESTASAVAGCRKRALLVS